ncbi:MAG: hypothetical protein AB1757_14730 [Acidobacteriota bacterium]
MELLKSHKWLFGWSAFLIILALVVKNIPMSKSVTQLVAVIELLLAIATGIAFGWMTMKRNE